MKRHYKEGAESLCLIERVHPHITPKTTSNTAEVTCGRCLKKTIFRKTPPLKQVDYESRYSKVLRRDIIYIKPMGPYCMVYTTTSSFLATLQAQVVDDGTFIRLNRFVLANPKYITAYHKYDKRVTLSNGMEIDLSRRKAIELRDQLTNLFK